MRLSIVSKSLIVWNFLFNSNLIFAEVLEDKKIFTNIYEQNLWGKGSGPGSYKENTEDYRKLLQEYFNDSKFNTIVDYGCGDFQIMELINVPNSKIYKGIDVVEKIIENNKKLFGKNNVQFYLVEDFTKINDKELLSGDLLVVKDVFIHWPNDKIQNFLDTVIPNFKYALITHDVTQKSYNKNIELGGYRSLDITAKPFNLKNLTVIKEYNMKKVYLYTNPNLIGL